MLKNKDLLRIDSLTHNEVKEIFELAAKLKRERGKVNFHPLAGRSVGMIFAKASTRTRVSFEVGVGELGGQPLYLDQGKMQVGRGETIADTAEVLSRYLHMIVIRTFAQSDVDELARVASIPVINALTDEEHPCQILADMMTMKENSGRVKGLKMVFYGDGQSNVTNSLIAAAKLMDFELVIASPAAFRPDAARLAGNANVSWSEDPVAAAKGADYLYTDVWVSMGCEDDAARRRGLLTPYRIDMQIVKAAKPSVKLMHCLPAHRGEELSAEVMDSPYSIVFDEAENRLHVQKAVMAMLMQR